MGSIGRCSGAVGLILCALLIGCRSTCTLSDGTSGGSVRDTIRVNVLDYGILGDSVSNNAARLKKLIEECRKSQESYWILQFSPGRYCYTDNRWLMGLPYVRIEGHGAEFQNIIEPVPNGEDCQALSVLGPHRKNDPVYRYNYRSGNTFSQIDETRIHLDADLGAYTCGDLVLLSGFEQQYSGYPPNARYFAYRTIQRIQQDKGIICLSEPLMTQYDSGWGDYAWGGEGRELRSGAPRILNLTTADYVFPRHLEIRDVHFVPNPNCTLSQAIAIPGEEVIFRNVTVDILYPQYNRKFLMDGGQINELVEFDKLADTILLRGVHVRKKPGDGRRSSLSAATSVNYLILEDCLLDSPVRVSPRHLIIRNTVFDVRDMSTGAVLIDGYNNFFPVYSVEVENVSVTGRLPSDVVLVGYDNINTIQFPENEEDGSCIEFPDSEYYRTNLLRSIDIGTEMLDKATGNVGHISSLRRNDSGMWCIQMEWSQPQPVAPHELTWTQTREVSVAGSIPAEIEPFSAARLTRSAELTLLQRVKISNY